MHFGPRVLLVTTLLLPATAPAGQPAPLKAWEREIMQTESFVSGHPDLHHREAGLRALEKGDFEQALRHLRRAARFSDKPAQAMLAELHLEGRGVPRDPALAYAWMDLAAERGYEGFLVLRERYWARLSDAEREDALARGPALFDEYGDAVAAPRLGHALRRVRASATGSRTGATPGLTVHLSDGVSVPGSRYYADRFWRPAQYRALQDSLWLTLPEGRVDVGDLEDVRDAPPSSD